MKPASLEVLRRITPIIAPSNNEARLIALGLLPDSRDETKSKRASELITALDNAGAYAYVQPPVLRVMWRMLKQCTDSGLLVRYDKGFRRTPLGDKACAVGSSVLRIGLDTAVSTRVIVGQSPGKTQYRDPIATRIAGWHIILDHESDRILNTDVLKVLAQAGMTSRGAASAMNDLVDDGVLVRDFDPEQPHVSKLGFHIASAESDLSPEYRRAGTEYVQLVHTILTDLGGFALRNRRALNEITEDLVAEDVLGDLFQVSAFDNPLVQNDGRRAQRTQEQPTDTI